VNDSHGSIFTDGERFLQQPLPAAGGAERRIDGSRNFRNVLNADKSGCTQIKSIFLLEAT
jgi:hypothetical protein